jgi:hypothetical protein
MRVRIDADERERARVAGRARQAYAVEHGIRDAYGFHGHGLRAHMIGALGEVVVADYLGVEWTAFAERFQDIEADCGTDLQVRAVIRPAHRLMLRPHDRDDQRFVSVYLALGFESADIRGWLWGAEGKRSCYWTAADRTRPPCWAVPASALRSTSLLTP